MILVGAEGQWATVFRLPSNGKFSLIFSVYEYFCFDDLR